MSVIVDLTYVNLFMTTRIGSAEFWTGRTDADKTALFTTANRMLDTKYTLVAGTTAHKEAVCEQALFLAANGVGVDQRMGLRAQGVTSAGVVKEAYSDLKGVPVCYMAEQLLQDALTSPEDNAAVVRGGTMTRDDDAT